MANEKNLIPHQFTEDQSREEAARNGQKGGIASGISRRRKKSLKEAADVYLSLPVSDRKRWNSIARKGVDPADIDNQMAIVVGLTEMASMGDARCAKVLIDILGEDSKENGDGGVVIVDDIP
ncbi:MAG: hypothetical protein IJZ15_04185 [Oscillospiraceae bacterium]|nr:hypothetical protein [Oscillospiraceae bacterium]